MGHIEMSHLHSLALPVRASVHVICLANHASVASRAACSAGEQSPVAREDDIYAELLCLRLSWMRYNFMSEKNRLERKWRHGKPLATNYF